MKTTLILTSSALALLSACVCAAPMTRAERQYHDYLIKDRGARPAVAECLTRINSALKHDRRYDRLAQTEADIQQGNMQIRRWEKAFSRQKPVVVSAVYEIPGQARRRASASWDDITVRCGYNDDRLEAFELLNNPAPAR
jgi:hypothetical protein